MRTLKTQDVFFNIVRTEEYEHLEMPKRCSEKTEAEEGEQCLQTSMGLIWLASWRLKRLDVSRWSFLTENTPARVAEVEHPMQEKVPPSEGQWVTSVVDFLEC